MTCAYAMDFPRGFAPLREARCCDGGVQRLHKEAESHNPQLPGVLSGRSVIYSVTVCLGLRENAAADGRKRDTPPAWYTASELAHYQTADNGDPQGLPQLRTSPPDNTSGSAPNSAARVVI